MAYTVSQPYRFFSAPPVWRFLLIGATAALGLIWITCNLSTVRDGVSAAAALVPGSTSTSASHSAPAIGQLRPDKKRPLVLYAYHESDTARKDLEFFVRNGLHHRADFVFIFNGETEDVHIIPDDLSNVWKVQRENTCFDMGALGEVLRADDLWKRYKRFITMNASLRGPFLPMYSSACWTDLFLDRVTDQNKLVGITMNCFPRPHIQSMIFATDDIGMGILLNPDLATSVGKTDMFGNATDPVGLSGCYDNWNRAVHAEVGTTELITSQGYGIDVLMTSYHGQPDRSQTYCQNTHDPMDHFHENAYFGFNIHPYETVFMKANRKVGQELLDKLTDWHMNMERTSWDMCKE